MRDVDHWSAEYIGQPYAQADCAAFAEQVQREVFGREINLPSERAAGLRGLSKQIQLAAMDYATPTSHPRDGDGVLMIGRGLLNHIGVYCEINGTFWVIHSMRDFGSVCLHRLRDIPSQGLAVEGFYTWKT